MKRKLALFFIVMSMFALSACDSSSSDIYKLYSKASEAMANVDSILMDTNINMVVNSPDESIDMSVTGSIAQVIKSETDIDMKMDLTTSIFGLEIPVEAYYKEGVYYVDSFGDKIKYPMDIQDMLAQANTQVINFPESAVKEQAVTDVTGGKELSFILDGSVLSSSLTEQLGDMAQLLSDTDDLLFGDVELKAVIDNDNILKSVDMVFSFGMGIEGENSTVTCNISMDILQAGGVVIEFPDDLDTYTLEEMVY